MGSIRGKVVDPEGRPVPGAWVWYRSVEGHWYAMGTVSEDGSFLLQDGDPPSVPLKATVPGADPEQEGGAEVTAAPGAEGVVLHVDPGLSLVVLPSGPGGCVAELEEEGDGPPRRLQAQNTEGLYRFAGLRAGRTYTLRIAGAADRALTQTGIPAEAGRIEVALAPGKSVRGRCTGPGGFELTRVFATRGRLSVGGKILPEAGFEVQGLCDGVWTVNVFARRGDERWRGSAEVEAGGEVEVVLAPDPR
jgi:hypothetical protein